MPEQKPLIDALNVSVIVDRKDRPGQIARTEWRANVAYGCPASPGDLVGIGASGKIDSCLLPTTGSNVFVNGNPVSDPNFNDFTPTAPLGFTNVKWQFDGAGNVSAYYATSGVAVSFGQITSGTNNSATMIVDTGASITVACPGSGVIEATELATDNCTPVVTNISHPTHEGMLLISQPGNASAVWADPLVQGLYPDGSNIAAPPAFATPTTIQPAYVGGKGTDGNLHGILTTPSGAVVVVSEDEAVNANHFAWDTGPDPIALTSGALTPLISISPQIAATVTFFLTGMDVFMAPSIGEFQLIKNGTLTGASFANVPGSNARSDTSATVVSGGTRVDSGYTQNGTRSLTYELEFIVGDTYTLAVQPQTGGIQKKANAALRWSEQTVAP
jgi:hypothetical protein